MTKENLTDALVKKMGISERQALECINVLLDEISKALARGEEAVLTGFGKFKVAQRKERAGINPKTGEKIKIPARKAPVFKPGQTLKAAVK